MSEEVVEQIRKPLRDKIEALEKRIAVLETKQPIINIQPYGQPVPMPNTFPPTYPWRYPNGTWSC